MLPVLINISFITIYTFGVFLVLAFFWSCFLLWKNIQLTSFKEEKIFDAVFVGLAGGLLVSRVAYIAFNFQDFGFSLGRFLLINGYPGLSLYAFIIGGLVSAYWYLISIKLPAKEIFDYMAAPILLALGIGKLGAFFSGVQVGTVTEFFLSIQYANVEGLRHLTPLYESIMYFIGAYIAYRMMYSIRRHHLKKGFTIYFVGFYISLILVSFEGIIEQTVFSINGLSVLRLSGTIILLTIGMYFLYYFRTSIIKFAGTLTNFKKSHGKSFIGRIYPKSKK